MALEVIIDHCVAFHDIDIMNIVWHGHYVKYCELARTALMQSCDLDWPEIKRLGFAMPVVDLKLKYRKAITYNQTFFIKAIIEDFEAPALDVNYKILSQSEEILAEASTRQTYFDINKQTTCYQIPDPILKRFRAYDQTQKSTGL